MSETGRKKIDFGEFTFETGGNILLRREGEAVVPLEPAAARVLRYFLENTGRLVSKEEILDAVWRDVFTTEDVLKRAVSQIRRALGDDARNARFIETHHRRGYRFIARPGTGGGESNTDQSESVDPSFDCFVGRGAVMSFLQAEFRRVLQGVGQPILIVGEPGIGKTQTAARFIEWTASGDGSGGGESAAENHSAAAAAAAVPLRVRFFDYEASFLPPYDIFLDLLGEACDAIFARPGGETDGRSGGTGGGGGAPKIEKAADLRQTIEMRLKVRLPDELFSNFSDPRYNAARADASRAIAPLAESFVRLARIRPLILIFDDVQWADETSRRIIGYLMRIAGGAPLMMIGLARRGAAALDWLHKQAVYRSFTILELAPLSAEDCRALVGEIFHHRLDAGEIPDKDLLKLHAATGGNPYFLVETLRLLMNENVIVKSISEKGDAGWRWGGIEDVPLPETVRMAARAKLAELSAAARDLVECAAVLGDAFQVKTLESMLANETAESAAAESSDRIESCLDEAVAAQVLTEQNVSGADDCQFYHTTLRRAVYMDLSPRRRRRLHARAMRAIENSHLDDNAAAGRFAAALAAHAENAGEFTKSLKLNLQACRAAVARFDWLEAAELISRAERVAAKIPAADRDTLKSPENLGFQALRGEIYLSVGRRVEAEKILSEAAAAAALAENEAGETGCAANILLNLGRTRILLGKYREAIAPLEKSLALSQSAADGFNASAALIQLASAKYASCDYEESCRILQQIIDEDDDAGGGTGNSYNRAVALGKLGWTRALQSRYGEAKKLLNEALEFHRTAGDLRERAVLSMCLNWCEYGTGDYEAAIDFAKRARREAQIVGEPYNESVALMRVAKARIAQGFCAEAESLLHDVWEKQKNLDAPHAQAETLWMRGRARLALGNLEEAGEDLRTALEMIRAVGDRDDEFRIMIDQARLRDLAGNPAGAMNLADRAAGISEEIGVSEGVGEALALKSGTLLRAGEIDAAVVAAREAVRRLEEFGSGERWRAHYALASALTAQKNMLETAAANRKTNKKVAPSSSVPGCSAQEIENALRRAVAVLDAMRAQFSSAEENSRRAQFTRSNNAPAGDLHDFLLAAGRLDEAGEIRRSWLLD